MLEPRSGSIWSFFHQPDGLFLSIGALLIPSFARAWLKCPNFSHHPSIGDIIGHHQEIPVLWWWERNPQKQDIYQPLFVVIMNVMGHALRRSSRWEMAPWIPRSVLSQGQPTAHKKRWWKVFMKTIFFEPPKMQQPQIPLKFLTGAS